jgi:hypothetical protein
MLTTPMNRLVGLLLAALALTSAGCIGAMQTTAHEPTGSATLKPTVTDKDAGLVGITPGFDLKRYRIIAIERFPVNDPEVKSDEDRKMAALLGRRRSGYGEGARSTVEMLHRRPRRRQGARVGSGDASRAANRPAAGGVHGSAAEAGRAPAPTGWNVCGWAS